ncbi:MAG: hypothetical protein WCD70_00160 [Alphaproteobacteria bacterium]
MNDTIPPLPELEIGGVTKKHGLNQAIIDRILRFVYEGRPDFYMRMAKLEGSGNKKEGDEFVKEFDKYLLDEVEKEMKEIDVTSTSVSASIFWEARRRARLMYGMTI